MKLSRPCRKLSSTLPYVVLVVMLVAGLALALASCRDLAADDTETTEAAVTETTAAAPGGADRISAENILFRDDFQDGNTEGWQVAGAWVVQQDGDQYTFDTTGQGYAFVPKGVGWAGDYAFKCSYALSAGALGFSFDATQAGRYYVYVDQNLISLVKEDAAGARTVLTQAQAPTGGARHYLTIAKKNGTIQVYVDRKLWLASQDASPLAAGTIMLGALDGTTAWVDDVLVNKILKALPAGTPAVAAVDPNQIVSPPEEHADLSELPEDDEDIPDLNEENLPDEIALPTVTFTGRPNDGSGAPGAGELTVTPGTPVVLEWQVQNASSVFLNDTPQPLAGSMATIAQEDFDHQLSAMGWNGEPHYYHVYVTVTGPDGGGEGAGETDLVITCTVTDLGDTDVTIHVQVRNTGGADAQALKLRWYGHEQSGVVDKQTGCTIRAGDSFSIDWIFRYNAIGNMHWMATIDEEQNMPDPNRANNTARGTVQVAE